MTNMLELRNQVRRVCLLAVAAIAISLPVAETANAQAPHDLVLRNARIVDGSGESRAHGKDERVAVSSFLESGEYLYRLVKRLSEHQ
jgi:acetylornithine deacetylase/succinyl-diaminopimelate desuccinylase-like protein